MKLVEVEKFSQELGAAVDDRVVVSSEIALTEVLRSSRRVARGVPAAGDVIMRRATSVLSGIVLLTLDRRTLELAGALDDRQLRSLDAIHVAAAVLAGDDLDAFVTYDRQQGRAAAQAGFEVLSPGA